MAIVRRTCSPSCRYSRTHVCTTHGGLKCHLIPDGMRAWRACTADYGHAGRSTWFRGIPDAPDNHSGRPGDRVWPRFPLIWAPAGLKTALGVFPACRPQFFRFFLNGRSFLVGNRVPHQKREAAESLAKNCGGNPRGENFFWWSLQDQT